MKIETCTELYYKIRSNFHPDLGRPVSGRSDDFKQLLTEYGATVNTGRRTGQNYVCDYVGISPGVDFIEFHDEKLYTMFLLRWS